MKVDPTPIPGEPPEIFTVLAQRSFDDWLLTSFPDHHFLLLNPLLTFSAEDNNFTFEVRWR